MESTGTSDVQFCFLSDGVMAAVWCGDEDPAATLTQTHVNS